MNWIGAVDVAERTIGEMRLQMHVLLHEFEWHWNEMVCGINREQATLAQVHCWETTTKATDDAQTTVWSKLKMVPNATQKCKHRDEFAIRDQIPEENGSNFMVEKATNNWIESMLKLSLLRKYAVNCKWHRTQCTSSVHFIWFHWPVLHAIHASLHFIYFYG